MDPFRRLWEGPRSAVSTAEASAELRTFDRDPHALVEETLGDARLPPARAALLMWVLRCPALRDVVLTQWASDAEEARQACRWQRDWTAGARGVPDFPIRLAGEGPRPSSDRLRAALALARGLASRAPSTHLPACLAVCGWLSWALGNSTHAAEYAARAREIDPRNSFAGLITGMTDAGYLPRWAFDPAGTRDALT